MDREIGFGVVGLGMGASRCETISKTKGARLVAVSDLNEERGKKISEKYNAEWHKDYHNLLENKKIDVIMVMTPSGTHMEIALDSARAGKNVIVTKPLEITLKRCDRIIEECKNRKVVLAVDFEMRYISDNVRIKKAIEEGRVGKLILGEIRLKWYRSQAYYDAGGWRGTWKHDGGGSLMNQTIHLVDILQWFMGDCISVYGTTAIMSHKIETEDIGLAILKFKNGSLGTIIGTTTSPSDLPMVVEVHGDKGFVSTVDDKITRFEYRKDDKIEKFAPEEVKGPINVIEDMVLAIKDGKEVLTDGLSGRKSVEIITAIYESSKTGKEVRLILDKFGGRICV